MASENITTCPICDHENFKFYNKAEDYTITGETFELKQCTHCNFIITSPRPDKDSIGKYYESKNYISHSGKSTTLFDKVYLNARNITLSWKHQLIKKYFSKPTYILDYGCGTGEFLNHMKNNGWNIAGVEPTDTARQKANQLLGNKVSKDLETFKANSVKLITLWHVLEHIHDLNNTILKLKSLLTQDGLIIIAVPNPKSHDSQHYKNKWAGYDVPRHLWHFTQDTINALLKKNGLEVLEIKPMKLDSFYVSLLSEGYQNPNQPKLISGIKAFIEGLVSNFSAKKSREYSSLIYIAKPK
jgi:2-polyprenyl-3-methyl-5-hydroxy-6-metoxy-1,4-benzoquinol methylase